MYDSAEVIKAGIIDWLLEHYDGIIIGNEVMYGSKRKVVDLLAIVNNEIIAIEIKSASDKLNRLPAQITEYYKVFDKVVLVAASSHIDEASALIPKGTGLFSFNQKIKKIRMPLKNHCQDKREMLYSINSSYLKNRRKDLKGFNSDKLRAQLETESKKVIHNYLVDFYAYRLTERFRCFIDDRGERTLIDDIPTLSLLTTIEEL